MKFSSFLMKIILVAEAVVVVEDVMMIVTEEAAEDATIVTIADVEVETIVVVVGTEATPATEIVTADDEADPTPGTRVVTVAVVTPAVEDEAEARTEASHAAAARSWLLHEKFHSILNIWILSNNSFITVLYHYINFNNKQLDFRIDYCFQSR